MSQHGDASGIGLVYLEDAEYASAFILFCIKLQKMSQRFILCDKGDNIFSCNIIAFIT